MHNSEDVTASQLSADFSPQDPAASTGVQNSMTILQSLASSHQSEDGEALHQFQSLRENLLEQQKQELEELFIQQRREQMLLQAEIEEHQKRMKVLEHKLYVRNENQNKLCIQLRYFCAVWLLGVGLCVYMYVYVCGCMYVCVYLAAVPV